MAIRCLLWDFGDTLCDERFIWGSGPEWMDVYDTFDDGLGDQWNCHELDTAGFALKLARLMSKSPDDIVRHMAERSRNHVEFYEFTYAYFRAKHLPQAIVTVNPDLFSHVIVPAHGLDEPCVTIVTSWEEGTTDKSVLCRLAIERIDGTLTPADALLIDNKQANLDAWAAIGGRGYHFRTDATFCRDVENGRHGLPRGCQ